MRPLNSSSRDVGRLKEGYVKIDRDTEGMASEDAWFGGKVICRSRVSTESGTWSCLWNVKAKIIMKLRSIMEFDVFIL